MAEVEQCGYKSTEPDVLGGTALRETRRGCRQTDSAPSDEKWWRLCHTRSGKRGEGSDLRDENVVDVKTMV